MIIPIVYYEGKSKWTADLNLKDRIEFSEEMERYIPDFTYQVVSVRQYTNEEASNIIGEIGGHGMGYLFENMDEMDIQAERRNTAREKQRAEAERQRADKEKQLRIEAEKREADERKQKEALAEEIQHLKALLESQKQK